MIDNSYNINILHYFFKKEFIFFFLILLQSILI